MKKTLLAGLATGLFIVGMAGVADANLYKIIKTDPGISWDYARAQAQLDTGWDLASITTEAENDAIKALLNSARTPSNRNEYWIGAYLDEQKNYRWVSNEAFSYTDWWPGEPNNVGNTESHVALDWRTSEATWKWNDEGAAPSQVIGFIAENTQPVPGPTPVPEPTTVLLLGAGIAGLAAVGRRKKRS